MVGCEDIVQDGKNRTDGNGGKVGMSVKDNTYGIAPLQDKMLDILKHFISVCNENGLRYCVTAGTCIGALRHHGFIPWDDDLDVCMPRPDYEKLWKIYDNSNEPKFKLCRTDVEKNYHHRVMQIVDIDTTFINKRSQNEDIEHGVYIDIIPLDACPKSPFKRFSQIVNSVLFSVYNIQNLPEFNGGKLMKFAVSVLLGFVRRNEKRIRIWKKAEKRMTRYKWDDYDSCIYLASSFELLFKPFPKEWFRIRECEFEDTTVVLPYEAEKFCEYLYGDYMQFPPVEDRHPRHNTVLIDLDNSYTKYKGKYYLSESR